MTTNVPDSETPSSPELEPEIVTEIASKFVAPSLFEVAEAMQEEVPIYFDRSGNFWIWDETHYEMVDDIEILMALRACVLDDEKKLLGSGKHAILDALKMTGRGRCVEEVPKDWIHLQDTIVDIETGMEIKPGPEYLLTAPIPHKLGTSKDTPTIDKLFEEWVGPEKKQLLYEICAYCLLDDYPIHRLFLLFGRGRNGKGQFKEIVLRLVGAANATATTIDGLIHSRFESARLYKKKVATIGETNFGLLEDTATIKMLTGGDLIPAEFKNKKPFEFHNTAKIIINTNSVPPTTDKTDAFYSRQIVVVFPNQFTKSKDVVDTIPPKEYDNLVAKCIEILRELLERGEFSGEGTIQEKAVQYEALSNPLNEFISDKCTKDANEIIPLWHIQEQFKEYLLSRGLRSYTDITIKKLIENNGFETEPNHRFSGYAKNGQWTGIVGLGLRNSPYLLKPDESVQQPQHTPPACGDASVGLVGLVGASLLSPIHKGVSEGSPTAPTAPTKQNILRESVERAGREWEHLKNCSINNPNLTDFCLWYCEQKEKDKKPSEIRIIAEHVFKITPPSVCDCITVRALIDIPMFVGYDGKNYQLKKSALIRLPNVNADPLIKRGAVEHIQMDSDILTFIRTLHQPFIESAKAGELQPEHALAAFKGGKVKEALKEYIFYLYPELVHDKGIDLNLDRFVAEVMNDGI